MGSIREAVAQLTRPGCVAAHNQDGLVIVTGKIEPILIGIHSVGRGGIKIDNILQED